jgi:hypothetical protein
MRELSRVLMFIVMLGAFACKKANDPNNETEHEAVNAVDLKFFQEGVLKATFTAEDPDGDGGAPPSRIDTIKLSPSANPYNVQIIVKNISNGVVKEVNQAIQEQGTSHEFYYLPNGVEIPIIKKDRDANGYPLGLLSDWSVNTTGTGKVTVKLMHKTLIKGPNDPPSKGHSDIQIEFPLKIQ